MHQCSTYNSFCIRLSFDNCIDPPPLVIIKKIPVGTRFSAVQPGLGAHPASSKMGTGSFPRVKSDRGVLLTTHQLLVPRSWKSRSITQPTLWATPGL